MESILAVDDDPLVVAALQEILGARYRVHAAGSGGQALSLLEGLSPDLILLDIDMPGLDGYEVLGKLKADYRWSKIPVLFLTALESRESEARALSLGAVDFILKPIVADILLRRVQIHIELDVYRKNLEGLVMKRTGQLLKTQDALVDTLALVAAFRDNETGAHIKRTTRYVQHIVDALHESAEPDYHLDKRAAGRIVKAAKLHDIGKVAIPDSILLKPGRLGVAEYDRIKTHTTFGALMIDRAIESSGGDSGFLETAREIIVSHHEYWDGTGYPLGLRGQDIPLSGRVMAIADVFDALTSTRPYKEPFSCDNALSIIREEAGIHFDPRIVELCEKKAFSQFVEAARSISNSDDDLRAWA